MLDRRGDNVTPLWFEESCRTEKRKINTLGSSAGKDDLSGLATQHSGRPFMRVIQHGSRASSHLVNAGRVSPNLVEERKHGLPDLGVQRCSCVVIEIDGLQSAYRLILLKAYPGNRERFVR